MKDQHRFWYVLGLISLEIVRNVTSSVWPKQVQLGHFSAQDELSLKLSLRSSWPLIFPLISLSSSAYDVVLRQKVAVKKLSRPFQSLIHSRRSYRELRLLKHMKHENVSFFFFKQTAMQLSACFRSVIDRLCLCLVSVSAGDRAAGRLHACGIAGRLQRTVNLIWCLLIDHWCYGGMQMDTRWWLRRDGRLAEMSDDCHGNLNRSFVTNGFFSWLFSFVSAIWWPIWWVQTLTTLWSFRGCRMNMSSS